VVAVVLVASNWYVLGLHCVEAVVRPFRGSRHRSRTRRPIRPAKTSRWSRREV